MAERNHWHVIPRTAPLCWLSMAAGVLLLVSSIVTLTTTAASAPVLEVIVAVLAVALMVLAGLGLARPELRGR
jgi:peptidoglycan/LPS O-acetylase OafA/YrhL